MKFSVKIAGVFVLLIVFFAVIACTGNIPSEDYPVSNSPSTFTIVFNGQFTDTQSDTVMPNPATKIIVSPAITVDALPTPPSMSGYTFGGWWTGKNGSGNEFTATTEFTSDKPVNMVMQVYAYWYKYKVTYNNDGSTYATRTITSGSTTVGWLPAPPAKTDYTFAGWWTGTEGTGARFTAETAVTEDITVYAKWVKNTDAYVYTVTYNTDSSTTVAIQYVTSTEFNVGILPPDPSILFYAFDGWYTIPGGGGTQFTAGTSVTANITVYAKWNFDPGYTVTYDSNGGAAVDSQHVILSLGNTVATGTKEHTLPTPIKPCYAFVGWYSALDGGDQFISVTPVSADIKVYARWAWDYPSTAYPQVAPPFLIGNRGPSCVGKVFYVTDGGYSGLEAAPPNWFAGGDPYSAWIYGTPVTDEFGSVTDDTQTALNGHTSTAIGTGLANSNAIVAQTGHTGSAAKRCLDYSVGEGYYLFDDWFLPSKDELAQLYAKRDVQKSGGFIDTGYWSSSENDAWNSWSQSFDDSVQYATYKGSERLVRPVRAFSFPH